MEKTLLLSSDKKCKRKVEGLDDLISRLPNEILIYILSFLSSKEACRTSVLSHTWKHLWPFFSGTLNFDDPSTRMDIVFGRKKSEFEMNKFVERVNSILKSHRASTLEGFRVKFELNNYYKHHIDKWIDFAISKRVKSLELDLSKCTFENVYEFPLERVKVSVGIKSLTSLTLERVHVTSELLENFLSSCPLLELLHVSSVRGLFNLKISGASLKLKFLHMHCPDCKIVEIVAPNLEYLGFDGIIDFHVDYAPRLLNVCFVGSSYGMRNAFRSLSSCLDRLEGLMVDLIMLGKDKLKFPKGQKLTNLRRLKWRVLAYDGMSLRWLVPLIEAAPNLRKFTLELSCINPSRKRKFRKVMKYPNEHLGVKEVEIVGFTGREIDMELINYLLKSATKLEKIVITPRCETVKTRNIKGARELAKELEKNLPIGVEFVLL